MSVSRDINFHPTNNSKVNLEMLSQTEKLLGLNGINILTAKCQSIHLRKIDNNLDYFGNQIFRKTAAKSTKMGPVSSNLYFHNLDDT